MNKRVLSALLCIVFIAAFFPKQSYAQTPAGPDAPHIMPPNPRLKEKIEQGLVKVPKITADAGGGDSSDLGPDRLVAPPLSGAINTLVVLVDFSDKVRTVTPAYFDTLMYAAPVPGRGSVRDYYNEISYGAIDIVTVNLPSSTGWKRAPQPLSYYTSGGDNCTGTYPNNCQKLAEDLAAAVNPYVDFSKYDNDKDGWMEPMIIVHSGGGAEMTGSAGDIWSHSWVMRNINNYDGVYTYPYVIQPEYWETVTPTTSDMTIGVFAHEMGHGFWDLPDLYDTDYSSLGVGDWSLMSAGSWNGPGYMGASPAWPDAWSRMKMGLVTPTYLSSNNASLTLPKTLNNPAPANTVYKLRSSKLGANEYFLIENRERTTGSYDQYLSGEGMLIWHVDEAKTYNNQECKSDPNYTCGSAHFLVALEQADGLLEIENYTSYGDSADPFPGYNLNRTWNHTSRPSSTSYYTANNTGISVTNISNAGDVMTANVTVGLDVPGSLTASVISATQINLSWTDTSTDETIFRIERSVNSLPFAEINTVPANVTSYNDTSTNCGNSYAYRVRAFRTLDGGSNSGYSNTAAVNAPSCLPPQGFNKIGPTNPTNNLGINGVTLQWAASTGATSYEWCYNTSPAWAGTCGTTSSLSKSLPSLTPGTTYYWNVRSSNAAGTIEANGGWWSFSTLPLPSTFNKTTPTAGAAGLVPSGLSLAWEPSSGAGIYEYCYNTAASCPGAWTTTTNTSAPLNPLTPGTTYYWQVRARNTNGTTDANDGWRSFSTLALPGGFAKSSPTPGAVNQPVSGLSLVWGPSSGASSYEYCVHTAASCPGEWAITTQTSAPLPDLAEGTTYYWQVRARNAAGATDSNSGWQSFTTIAKPGGFGKFAPGNGAAGLSRTGLSLNWASSSSAASYEVCYNTTPSCPGDWPSTSATTYLLPMLDPGTTYYWQVRARNTLGTTEASGGWYSFTTLAQPGGFDKTGPENGATGLPTTITLTWDPSDEAVDYQFCISLEDGVCPDNDWSNVGTSRSIPINWIEGGTTYFWQVRALNDSGITEANGGWYSFTTANVTYYHLPMIMR